MMDFKKHITEYDYLIATDGACKGNPGPGTWAFAVYRGTEYVGHKKGNKKSTTNNHMELQAICKALKWAARANSKVNILTDSAYCLNGITKWMNGWYQRGWKTAGNTPIKNLELWQEIHTLWNDGSHTIEKVKGHSGNVYNDKADSLCNEEYINVFF
jgi:ribonuclease HI